MNNKYKLYEEGGKQIVERLVYPKFKGEVTFPAIGNSDIENIEMIDDCTDAITLARAMTSAMEFLQKGHQIK